MKEVIKSNKSTIKPSAELPMKYVALECTVGCIKLHNPVWVLKVLPSMKKKNTNLRFLR